VDEPNKTVVYAKGAEACFVMLAILLSITLCSLDQVSIASTCTFESNALRIRAVFRIMPSGFDPHLDKSLL
jgi:hypothetical protein